METRLPYMSDILAHLQNTAPAAATDAVLLIRTVIFSRCLNTFSSLKSPELLVQRPPSRAVRPLERRWSPFH